jgi:hypothetical protein
MKSIIDVLDDPALLGSAIKDKSTFRAWYVALKAVFSLPMDEEELAIYRECTGRNEPATVAFQIVWLIIGRRGAKSLMMSLIAVYKAVFTDWTPYLAAGERAIVLLVAADREQAKILRRYIGGIFASSPMLNQRVISETADSIELTGGVVVEVATCSYKTVRGRSICVALLDESAFWSEGGANPDREVWRAIRASMASFGSEALAVIASSPYAKRGLLYENFKAYFGKDDRINLVWRAGTKTMNPTISDEFLAAEREADPVSFASEYLAQFREGLDSYIQREIVEAAIDVGVIERPRLPGVEYFAFVDPSGGAGQDAMVLGISHREGDIATLDQLTGCHPAILAGRCCRRIRRRREGLRCDAIEGRPLGRRFRRRVIPQTRPHIRAVRQAQK